MHIVVSSMVLVVSVPVLTGDVAVQLDATNISSFRQWVTLLCRTVEQLDNQCFVRLFRVYALFRLCSMPALALFRILLPLPVMKLAMDPHELLDHTALMSWGHRISDGGRDGIGFSVILGRRILGEAFLASPHGTT